MKEIDFGRSFVRFTTTRVAHTPRLQLDACCTLTDAAGSRRYYLSCPCIGEEMYTDGPLVHLPPAEFVIVLAPGDQFMIIKRCADAASDVRSAHRVGEAMPTHSGVPATMLDLDATIRTFEAPRALTTYGELREAILGDIPMTGRTTYQDADCEVVMEYPARTVNIAHDREVWQIDAGPVMVPSEPVADLEVTRLNLAFLVYNSWDWGELAIRRRVPVGGAATAHFGHVQRIDCRHQLYAAW